MRSSCSAICPGCSEQMKQLFPGEDDRSRESNGRNIVLSGIVSRTRTSSSSAVNLAVGYVDKQEEVARCSQIREGAREQPGAAARPFRRGEPQRDDRARRVLLHQPARRQEQHRPRRRRSSSPAPAFDDLSWTKASSDFGSDVTTASGKIAFSDFLELFLFNEEARSRRDDQGACRPRACSRALPNLTSVAESGKEASFLAGGEFPVPIAQGSGGSGGHHRPCSRNSASG